MLSEVNLQNKESLCFRRNGCKLKGDQYWRILYWSDELKINFLGVDAEGNVLRWKGKKFHIRFRKKKKPLKHGREDLMVWGYFSAQDIASLCLRVNTMKRFVHENLCGNCNAIICRRSHWYGNFSRIVTRNIHVVW